METTILSRIEQAIAYVNEVSLINERFKGTNVSVDARVEFNDKGKILISTNVWVAGSIILYFYTSKLESDENYNEFLSFRKESEELLAKSADEIEMSYYEQKLAELKEKLNQHGK